MLSDKRLITSLITIVADVCLTSFRILLAYITGSSALMADAYHSVTDLSVSVIFLVCMLIKVWQENSGNHRRMAFARKIESFTVIVASLVILCIPYKVMTNVNEFASVDIENIWLGILGVIVIILSVFAIARLKTYVGRKTGSLALEADGYHSMVDLFTSVAVLFSLIGLLVGIDLDEFVAFIIAILIGLSGFELLLSGLKSLFRNEDIEQISLIDVLRVWFVKLTQEKAAVQAVVNLLNNLYGNKYPLLALSISLYLLSGFVQVPLGYQGIVQTLNRTIAIKSEAGLAYAPPWPFGQTILVPKDEIKSVIVGSKISDYTRRNGERMWFEIHSNRANKDDTTYIQTGDDNLIFLQIELQYQIKDPALNYFEYENIDVIVMHLAESSLWKQVATTRYVEVLTSTYSEFSDDLQNLIEEKLKVLDIPVFVKGVYVKGIQPPAPLVAVYRDVVNASQDKENIVNKARAQSYEQIPIVKAQSVKETAEVKAAAVEHVYAAKGDSHRFELLSVLHNANSSAFEFERYVESMGRAISGKNLVVVDPMIDKHDYRIWASPRLNAMEKIENN
ncbi:cation transporter [Vibrio astriarenae]